MNLREKLTANILAIESALKAEKERRKPNSEEKTRLKGYTGFGELKCVLLDINSPEVFSTDEKKLIPLIEQLQNVLKFYSKDEKEYKEYLNSIKTSVLTAFYTSPLLIRALNQSFGENDFIFPDVLDPAAGMGAFFKIKGEKYTAIEKDILTGKILKALNPDKTILIDGFEKIPKRYSDSFNLVTSNIPFGDFKVYDPDFYNNIEKRKSCETIHTYYFEKGLDMLKDGGLLAYITSTGIMDNQNDNFRRRLMHRANLISAIRLPEGTFEDTKVLSDLIVLQRNDNKTELSNRENLFISREKEGEYYINSFYKSYPHNIISTEKIYGTNPYGKPAIIYKHAGGIKGISADLGKITSADLGTYIDKDLYSSTISKKGVGQLNLFNDFFGVTEENNSDYFSYNNNIYNRAGSFQISENKVTGIAISESEAKIFNGYREIIAAYIEVRDSYFILKNKEESSHLEFVDLRQQLNDKYDYFRGKFGYITENAKYLINDIAFPEIRGLEIFNNKKFIKADIFNEPIAFIKGKKDFTIEEALSVSLNKFNKVNLKYISQLTQNSEENIIGALKGQIYLNPETNEFEPADMYLSGNVIEKIKIVGDEYSNSGNEYFLDSLEALKKIIPSRIPLEDIGISLGERWIPEAFYNDFASKKFGNEIQIKYLQVVDDFSIEGYGNYLAREKYGVRSYNRYYSPQDVLRFALLNNIPDMTKKEWIGTENITVPDNEGIQRMNAAVSLLQNEFNAWLYSLPVNKKEELESIYNETFNCYVKPIYDGSYQSFPGLDLKGLGIPDLYQSQKDAILCLKNENGGIIDHEVGGGKTLIMCVGAAEMKRLRLANKPCILGLKANIQDIAQTFKRAYPGAKILYATKNDFSKENRENFFNKIQNNNWDCIIMTHEQFKSIPQSTETQKEVINEEIDKIEAAMKILSDGKSSKAAEKGLLKRKENLQAKLNAITQKMNDAKDNIVDFKTMGIDFLFIDESHKFKNLTFQTRHQRVAGLGNSNGSDRALNLLFALRTIQKKTGKDLGAAFLSGTIISNSLTELYNIFNYLRPKEMMRQNISSFDAWASVYTLKSKDYEFNVTNNIILKERFRNFIKVPELAMFYSQITDFRTAADIGVIRPEPNEIFVVLEQTEQQKVMFERLKEFAKTGDGSLIYRAPLTESEEKAKMLIATNTAKKASLDMRLIKKDFKDESNNKLNIAAEKIYEYYQKYDLQKGTQFVFSDLGTYKPGGDFNIYSALKANLVGKGIPENEIQFIQLATTEKKRMNLFEMMNNGKVRVLLGSTEMLGTGVNAQNRCVAIHHLDIPWTPKDLEQRNGRGIRKGNEVAAKFANNKVDILVYATKGTLDTYKFNLLKNKTLFISQIKNNNIGIRNLDEGALDKDGGMNYAEYIAILSGNTDLLKKSKLEKVISQLKEEENICLKQEREREYKLRNLQTEVTNNIKNIKLLKTDLEKFLKMPRGKDGNVLPDFRFNEIKYSDIKKIGEILNEEIDKAKNISDYKKIGEFGPFDLLIKSETSYTVNNIMRQNNKLYIAGEIKYTYNNGEVARSPVLAAGYPEKALSKIDNLITSYVRKNNELNDKIKDLKDLKIQFINRPKLEAATNELNDINIKIREDLKKSTCPEQTTETRHHIKR